MARFVEAIDLPLGVDDAFRLLAEFHRSADWDPGVVAGEPLTPGPPRRGSRFRVVAAFLGRRMPLEYEIAAFEPPHRLLLEGGGAGVRAVDEITLAPRDRGTRVTWEARLDLAGWRRWLDPLLDLAFRGVGRLAVRGLQRHCTAGPGALDARSRDPGPCAP